MVLILGAQIFTMFFTGQQPWFEPYVVNEDDDYASHDTAVLFAIGSFQYIILVMVFSKGAPYRKTIFSNYYFLLNLVVCIVVTIYSVIDPFQGYNDLLELTLPPPMSFRGLLVGIAIINCVACFILEMFIMDNESVKGSCEGFWKKIRDPKLLPYEKVEAELQNTPNWPPASTGRPLADVLQLVSGSEPGAEGVKLTVEDEVRRVHSSKGNVNMSYIPDVTPSHRQEDCQTLIMDNNVGGGMRRSTRV